ncbi:hypothetical protein MHYP_G00204990 [Metynnis hypsauchen]
MVTVKGCSSLVSALKSIPSHLRELDLTYNHPGESGVKLLTKLLEDPHCTLVKLQVDHGGKIRMKPGLKKCNTHTHTHTHRQTDRHTNTVFYSSILFVCMCICVCVCVCVRTDAVDLSLDPNTVNRRVSLFERNKMVTWVGADQRYPDHSDRFEYRPQVLSVESLTGRCYWEVQWSGTAAISVSYRGISRKGDSKECVFGRNNQSWSLNCSNNSYTVRHSSQKTDLPAPPSPSNRVGVYLDWGSGTLSFYTVSPNTHTLTHLHTFNTTFTEPLYAGFWINYNSSVSLCEIE